MTTADRFSYVIITPKKSTTEHWEATAWCEQQFGPRWSVVDNRSGVWCCFWRGRGFPGQYEWMFHNEQDAILFTLKWL